MELERVNIVMAKLLKEKGFDWSDKYGIWCYDLGDESLVYIDQHKFKTAYTAMCILAPTQALVCMWLRDVHGIFISVRYNTYAVESCNGWYAQIRKGKEDKAVADIYQSNSYEQAEEAAIEYVLKNLI